MEEREALALRVLLVDDDADVLRMLESHLRDWHYDVIPAENGFRALELLQRESVDIVITDVRMPGMDGFALLKQVRAQWPNLEVIVVTAYGDVDNAVRALREGAFDFFTKPLNVHDITASLERTARYHTLRRENERFRERLDRLDALGHEKYGLGAIIGQSPATLKVKEQIVQVSRSRATSVLIEGETGTGKELVARVIHYESERLHGPFVAVDCSAIPASLVESEFYGHVKGAFTDARGERKGHFELADGGTLFLDEIGDMDREMQTRLLRTLEERQVRRLGSEEEVRVDVRVISATNQDLEESITQGRFRKDLYYRLNTFTIYLPPLRERVEDIIPLARHFLARFGRELRKDLEGFMPEAQGQLVAYPYQGNIRELRNIVEYAVIACERPMIGAEDLDLKRRHRAPERAPEQTPPAPARPTGSAGLVLDSLDLVAAEKKLIRQALRATENNQVQAARLLGITRDALRRRIARYESDLD